MRVRCAIALTLWCSAGCRQLLGFDDPAVAVDGPRPSFEVTGMYREYLGRNNAAFAHEVTTRIPSQSELGTAVRLSDGSVSPVVYRADGSFSFMRFAPDEVYRLTLAGLEYQHVEDHLDTNRYLPGRSDARPVTMATSLQFQLGSGNVGYPFVMSTGVFGFYNPPVPINTGTFSVDSATAIRLDQFGLLDASANDRLYAGYYQLTLPPQEYLALSSLASFAVTQQDGIATPVVGVPIPVARPNCVRMQARRVNAINRIRTALPQFAPHTADYRITQSGTFEHTTTPQQLVVVDGSSGSDANLDVTYGTPFPGTQVLTGIAVFGNRNVMLPGLSMPLRLGAVGVQMAPLPVTTSCEPVIPTFDIGIPGPPSLAGTLLNVDLLEIPLPAEDLQVSWTLGSDGPVDYSEVTIHEVDVSRSPPILRELRRIRTVTESARLSRADFVSGRFYVLGVRTVTGNPRARYGDFQTFEFPTAFMETLSAVFAVAD